MKRKLFLMLWCVATVLWCTETIFTSMAAVLNMSMTLISTYGIFCAICWKTLWEQFSEWTQIAHLHQRVCFAIESWCKNAQQKFMQSIKAWILWTSYTNQLSSPFGMPKLPQIERSQDLSATIQLLLLHVRINSCLNGTLKYSIVRSKRLRTHLKKVKLRRKTDWTDTKTLSPPCTPSRSPMNIQRSPKQTEIGTRLLLHNQKRFQLKLHICLIFYCSLPTHTYTKAYCLCRNSARSKEDWKQAQNKTTPPKDNLPKTV